MTLSPRSRLALRRALRPPQDRRPIVHRIGAATAVLALGATVTIAVVPVLPPSSAQELQVFINENAQSLTVSRHAEQAAALEQRAGYSATAGIDSLVASGTNHDWAKLVLLFGGWPMSENNVTVITRWMRQENGPESWYNRNNPLNNGWGSGGGAGTGSYASLLDAAKFAAKALSQHPGYSAIRANFAASSPTAVTEAAIWASPWASGHYANGGHWHYTPVPVVKAPASAW